MNYGSGTIVMMRREHPGLFSVRMNMTHHTEFICRCVFYQFIGRYKKKKANYSPANKKPDFCLPPDRSLPLSIFRIHVKGQRSILTA